MKQWYEVVVPHPDIRGGNFDESVFAADLSDVIADRGPLEYRDAVAFFRKTYPTQGLVNLLAAIASRLAGKGKGEAVIQIQTPFGGGKTHSLIALYHLFTQGGELRDSEVVLEVLEHAELRAIPTVRVATFTGTAADPLKGKTPWGEIAEQLGNYALLAEHDRKRRSPGKDLLHRLLAGTPTVLLMDEVAEYAVKAKDFREQVIAFFQELTETVKVLPQCALAVTLPSSAPYGEDGERALHQLQQVFGRVEAIYTPVEGEEIYEVIRRRLFEDARDSDEAVRVADSYWELYQRLGDDVPREVRELPYRDKMRKAYPFHPEVIDLLFERWSTYPTFQRTRGVLRFLAEVVADLYRGDRPTPLIQPAHLNLASPTIRRELLKHIGNEYEGVIAADIVGSNAKAQKLNDAIGTEYARFRVASGLATAIFFGSFSGGQKKGLSDQRLRLALLREGIPPALVGDALRRLEEELWYLRVEGGLFAFSSQPNINRVIVEREEAVQNELVTREIRSWLEKLAGTELRVTLWPKVSQDVPDTKELKLAILSPEHTKQSGATGALVDELFRKSGERFRTYQNTLLVLAPDGGEFETLRQKKVKRFLALRAIRDDKALMRQLTEEDKKTLESKLKDLESDVPFGIISAYRHLAKLSGKDEIEWLDLGVPTVGERGSLTKRVREYLKTQELLVERLSPEHLLKKALREDEQEKPLADIADGFLRYPQLPMVGSREVIEQAICQGVLQKIFGIKVGERVYFGEAPSDSLLETDAVLIRKEFVPQSQTPPDDSDEPGVGEPPPGPQEVGKQHVKLHVKVPWDKLSDFVRGVMTPLHSDGAELKVEVIVDARSESRGIKPATLEHKVNETLKQIGAEVKEQNVE